jgi:superfamily II DNA or RNA helicase
MIGRCLRPQGDKVAVVLDHVGNTQRLGHHLDEREWTLKGLEKKEQDKAPSVKVCPACFVCMPSGRPVCPECGFKFTPERRELMHVDGELEEVGVKRRQERREQAQARTLEDLVAIGKRRGMKYPRAWAKHVLAARQAKGQWRHVA